MWFSGNIAEAVAKSKGESRILLVFIQGADQKSTEMLQVWCHEDIVSLCSTEGIIPLKLASDSESCKQFAEIFPVVCVPISFLIGQGGKPLEIIAGYCPGDELAKRIMQAVKVHKGIKEPATVPTQSTSSMNESEAEAATHSRQERNSTPNEQISTKSAAETDRTTPHAPTPNLDEKVQHAENLLEMRREQRAREEAEKAKEMERKRRQEGKDVAKFMEQQKEREMKEVAEQRRKQKLDDQEYLKRLKDQIAADRAEKAKKYDEHTQEETTKATEAARRSQEAARMQAEAAAAAKMTQARLQFRFPDGHVLTNIFSADATLQEVRDYLTEHAGPRFSLVSMHPRHEFGDVERMKSLRELSLVPSAVLLVFPEMSKNLMPSSAGAGNFVQLILGYVWMAWAYIKSFLPSFSSSSNSSAKPSTSRDSNAGSHRHRPNQASASVRPSGGSNMARFRNHMDEDEKDDNASWNGNSTQQL